MNGLFFKQTHSKCRKWNSRYVFISGFALVLISLFSNEIEILIENITMDPYNKSNSVEIIKYFITSTGIGDGKEHPYRIFV